MADALLAALSGGDVLHANSLATVATNCVLIRTSSDRSRAIVSLDRITRMEMIRFSYPAFLAIAAGLLLMAAAAYYSRDGGSAQFPLATLGTLFIFAYLITRKASVLFWMGRESVQSTRGGLREAEALIQAVQEAQSSS
jgi:uncharacterized membrane protein